MSSSATSLTLRTVMATLGAGLLLAACSGNSPPVASPSPTPADYLGYQERIGLVVECIERHGFEASSYEGFGVSVEAAGDAQLDEAGIVEGECWEEVDARFPPPPPLSVEETYYYMLDIAECLRENGYDVPDAPSLEAYIDQLSADSATSFWDPYGTLSQEGHDIWKIQREECPPYAWAR